MSTTDVSCGASKQNKNAASPAVLPEIPILRVASELQLLYALMSSFAEQRKEHFFPTVITAEIYDVESRIVPHFIHLLSKGDNQDLLSDDNRCHLFRLGVGILKCAGMWSAAEAAEYEFEGPAARDDQYSKDWWISQELQDDAAVDELKKLHTELPLGKELNAEFLNCKQARYPDIWKAVMIGYLCLKINRNGFGAREEDALRILGGEPDAFRAVIDSKFEYIGESSPVDTKWVRLLSIRNNSQRADVAEYTAGFLEQHGFFYFDSNGSVRRTGQPGWFDRLINEKLNPIDLSSRFQGYTEENIKNLELPRIQKILIGQIRAAHKAMMEGPPASGERQIIPGVWASTIREYILQRPYLSFFNLRDLSNLDLSGVNLSRIELQGCRFDGTDLSGARCLNTHFRGSSFSWANFSGALLSEADIRDCDLSYAILNNISLGHDQPIGDGNTKLVPPIVNGNTKFLPDNFRTNADIQQHSKRFVGWTEEMFEPFLDGKAKNRLSPTQRRKLTLLKNHLLNPNRSSIQIANSQEICAITSVIGTSPEEVQKALSRLYQMTDSAAIPVLRDNDYSGQDLTERPLKGAFIERLKLIGASLAGQDLRESVISNCDLSEANLRGANLSNALLVNVNLSSADLRDTNLDGTQFINCYIDGVKLDGVKMINTEMQQCTFANVTIAKGVIEDLIVCQSYLHDLNFAGSAEESGVFVHGLALVDSVGLNLQFTGNTTVGQLELMGSVGIASGPGILDTAEIIIVGSEWRDQMIQVVTDPVLGVLEHGLQVERVPVQNTQPAGRFSSKKGPDQTSTAFLVRMLISREGDPMGSLPVLEHLEKLDIGYHFDANQEPDSKNPSKSQIIIPARCEIR